MTQLSAWFLFIIAIQQIATIVCAVSMRRNHIMLKRIHQELERKP